MEVGSREIERLISDLCEAILVTDDQLNYAKIEEYINALSDSEKRIINTCSDGQKKDFVCTLVEKKIDEYIDGYCSTERLGRPFDFDSSVVDYQICKNHFNDIYKSKNNNLSLPLFFHWVFDRIKEASVQFHFIEKIHIGFFDKKEDSIAENTIKGKIEAEVSKQVSDVVKEATSEAETQAKLAAQNAKNAVKTELVEVTRHISETSVTILGIFAAIVLTVVGGFIYSSSVFTNMDKSNIGKLVCVSALIGFVCVVIMTCMFKFIAFLSGKKGKIVDIVTIVLSIVLLLIFLGSFAQQICSKEETSDDKKTDVDTSSTYVESTDFDDNTEVQQSVE